MVPVSVLAAQAGVPSSPASPISTYLALPFTPTEPCTVLPQIVRARPPVAEMEPFSCESLIETAAPVLIVMLPLTVALVMQVDPLVKLRPPDWGPVSVLVHRTVWFRVAELSRKKSSPPYLAVIVFWPTCRIGAVNTLSPVAFRLRVPRPIVLRWNRTCPLGVTAPGLTAATVAVNVTA